MAFNEGLSVADALALRDSTGNNGGFFGGDSGWVLFLFFLLAWGNNGFLGNNGGGFGGMAGLSGALTRAEMNDGFNNQDVRAGIRGIQQGLCDGFYAMNSSLMSGFHGVDNALCSGFNSVNGNITDVGYAIKDCCCQTGRAIDSVKYENAKNTCDIITAGAMNTRDIIDSQNAGFQRVIDFLTNDKIDSLRTELQAAQLQLGNLSQTNSIIEALKPCPKPAYLTCSPYASYNLNNLNCCCGTNFA